MRRISSSVSVVGGNLGRKTPLLGADWWVVPIVLPVSVYLNLDDLVEDELRDISFKERYTEWEDE